MYVNCNNKIIFSSYFIGVLEQTRLPFHLIKTDSYLAIRAVSKSGKVSNMSNVVHIQLPDELLLKFTHASQINQLDISSDDIGKKHAFKKYDQFALNTSCFWRNTGSNIILVHSLIRGVLIQSCPAGAKNFTNYVFCHSQFTV